MAEGPPAQERHKREPATIAGTRREKKLGRFMGTSRINSAKMARLKYSEKAFAVEYL
jgi:hypothetical protein